jgi:hypothetical protein
LSAGLILSLQKVVSFNAVLETTHGLLLRLLNLETVPGLTSELPPQRKVSKHVPSLENRLIDISFPGAYIKFQSDDESVVHFHVFEGGPNRTNLMVGCTSVSTTNSEVLTAAVAAAAGQLIDTSIIDAGTHWTNKEEGTADELVDSLALRDRQTDFAAAVELVYHKMAVHKRHPRR